MSEPYLDPLAFSRQLGKLRGQVRAFQRAARLGLAKDSPFSSGLFPGKSEYERVSDLPAGDPLRAALLIHLHALIRERVQLPWTGRALSLTYFERHLVVEPVSAELTLSEVRKRARTAIVDQEPWARTKEELSAPLGPVYEELWHREPEIDRRLGAASEQLEPWDAIAPMRELALEVLTLTREPLLVTGYLGDKERNELELRDASEGWPARLGLGTLLGLFREKEWYRGLAFEGLALPARLTPASFLLGLSEVGFQMGLALLPRELPFVVAHTPYDDVPQRVGAELALVATTRAFQARRLGLGRARAERAERALAVIVLAEVRRRASRFLLTEAAKRGRDALNEISDRLGRELPYERPRASVLAGLYRPEPSGIDFFSLLEAGRQVVVSRQTFDEDWFDSPRALEELRARAETPRHSKVQVAPLRTDSLAWLNELIGRL